MSAALCQRVPMMAATYLHTVHVHRQRLPIGMHQSGQRKSAAPPTSANIAPGMQRRPGMQHMDVPLPWCRIHPRIRLRSQQQQQQHRYRTQLLQRCAIKDLGVCPSTLKVSLLPICVRWY